jgi:hypothetical protein
MQGAQSTATTPAPAPAFLLHAPQNSATIRLGFRLHLPSASLAQQIMAVSGDTPNGDQDVRLRTLKPGEGE